MYICVCNGLTETDVRGAMREGRAGSPEDVLMFLRGSAQCGVCRASIATMLAEDPDNDDFPPSAFGPG